MYPNAQCPFGKCIARGLCFLALISVLFIGEEAVISYAIINERSELEIAITMTMAIWEMR